MRIGFGGEVVVVSAGGMEIERIREAGEVLGMMSAWVEKGASEGGVVGECVKVCC